MWQRHLPLVLTTFLLLPLFSFTSDLDSDRSALLSFRSAVSSSSPISKWDPSASPCSFSGVKCDHNRVTSLRLPASNLFGAIPPGTLGNLTALRTLSLRYNALTSLPDDMANLVELRALYLHRNSISGQIPDSILKMTNLMRLNLALNKFSGEIPIGLKNLRRLGTLYLENNGLVGQIPDLNLPILVYFNVSYNSINGSIPRFLEKQPLNSFLGLNGLCGGPFPPCKDAAPPSPAEAPGSEPAADPSEDGSKKHKLSGGAIAGIVIGCVVGFLILMLLLFLLRRKKHEPKEGGPTVVGATPVKPMEAELVDRAAVEAARAKNVESGGQNGKMLVFFNNGGKEEFGLEELLKASAEVLGKGSYGTTYRAVLEKGIAVAVKRLKDVNLNERELKEKIEVIGEMNHENLVPLMAYYFSRDEKLLVYEHMPLGSLSARLHGSRNTGQAPLSWSSRAEIALASARGLSYIHSKSPTSSHGNIKSSNILLWEAPQNARVSDHGLADLIGHALPTTPARGAGYRAPEVATLKNVSQKADVYSFGVLLLELLTGKAPLQTAMGEEGLDLPRWVQSVVREEWPAEVFDREPGRGEGVEEETMRLLKLALDCTAVVPDGRPAMAHVAEGIEAVCRNLKGSGLVED